MSVCFWGHYRCVALRCAALCLLLDTPAVLRYFAICSVVVVLPACVVRCWREARRRMLQTSALILSKFCFSANFDAKRTAQRRVSDPNRSIPSLILPSRFSRALAAARARRGIPTHSGTARHIRVWKVKILRPWVAYRIYI